MNNISYKIYENNKDNNKDNNLDNYYNGHHVNDDKQDNNGIKFDDLINDIKNSICNDHKLALETDYNTNYNVKQLKQIITYYEIQLDKRNLKKELINEIIIFELDNDNKNIVNKRKQLWFYMKQLKEDKCLNKFILFDI
jgi:hypothetical protein